ncbi:uncharacterized protein CPUR_08794 [Claviceps purpurea 20.1]|uniref:Uncharacterized protein n=1 Tax=Claviceps purpurea (strain 20.1) TaxID=1111077 RepID=M1WDK3_CLAP2|nr:uncharacterized protein CPUR_08794 [Claviceps purpurea 20.1]
MAHGASKRITRLGSSVTIYNATDFYSGPFFDDKGQGWSVTGSEILEHNVNGLTGQGLVSTLLVFGAYLRMSDDLPPARTQVQGATPSARP